MVEFKGKYETGKVFIDYIEESAQSQIMELLNCPAFENSHPRWMPDVHAGAGCVIGTTLKVTDKIVPNLVGVDIGCGMLTFKLGNVNIKFDKLDKFIHNNIPLGTGSINDEIDSSVPKYVKETFEKLCDRVGISSDKELKALGSLGSGNHFIEVNEDDDNNKYLVIHSGSRHFGLSVALFYQNMAIEYCKDNGIKISKALSYLEGIDMRDYLYAMSVATEFSKLNRRIMGNRILKHLKLKDIESFETIHNYIGEDRIIRKGAISAYEGVELLIPLNAKDGSIIGIGKGNEDWNYSGPHGAGRKLARRKAKESISLEQHQHSMNGVWSSTVSKSTIDESPLAYKNPKYIIENIGDNIEIVKIIKSIYNVKG